RLLHDGSIRRRQRLPERSRTPPRPVPRGPEARVMEDRIRDLAQTLWDYHHVNHQLARADAILVLCSHDKTVARRGAALFLEGWAPLLIFAGGLGAITRHLWQEPEADQFAAIAAG